MPTAAEVLAQAMRERGLTKRRLAVLLHEADGSIGVEGYRHSIYRWLAGTQPNDLSVHRLARVLGIREEQLVEARPRLSSRIETLAAAIRDLEARVEALEGQASPNSRSAHVGQ